nr:metal-sensing transcriptional repressor [Sphingomonas sp. CFBP 13733]
MRAHHACATCHHRGQARPYHQGRRTLRSSSNWVRTRSEIHFRRSYADRSRPCRSGQAPSPDDPPSSSARTVGPPVRVDIAQQLQAVENAIASAKRALINDHIEHCLVHAEEGEGPQHAIDQLRAISKYW